MSTLDEITKEKQRLGEALARVDAQRDKLTSQLAELEAAERVLARYSKGTQTRKTLSGKTATTATQAAAPARQSAHRRTTIAKPAGVRRSSPSLNDQVLALAIGNTGLRLRVRQHFDCRPQLIDQRVAVANFPSLFDAGQSVPQRQ